MTDPLDQRNRQRLAFDSPVRPGRENPPAMLEGEWTVTSVEYGGTPLPPRGPAPGRLFISGTRFSLQMGGAPREVGAVDYPSPSIPSPDAPHPPGDAPPRLDLVWRDSTGRETRRIRAIYRARGALLQLCYFPDETAAAPSVFESAPAQGRPPAILVRCRRVE